MNIQTQFRPDQIAESVFIAPDATVLGDVTIGKESTVLFGAVIRGDTESVNIGCRTNVQDLCVLHADPGVPCSIGDRVTIGHGAIVHGASVGNDVMIGMRAVVLNGAVIGAGSLVGAGAVVTAGMSVPPGSVVTGMPAAIRGPVKERHTKMIRRAAEHYVEAGRAYRAQAG